MKEGSKSVLVHPHLHGFWSTFGWMDFVCIVLAPLVCRVLVYVDWAFTDLEFSLCQTGMGFERCSAGVVGQVDELEEVAISS